jgi:LCP family protein required for cell wall assembly
MNCSLRRANTLTDLLVVVAGLSLVATGTWAVLDAIAHPSAAVRSDGTPHLFAPPALLPGLGGPKAVLLIGADDRQDRGRADTLIVAYVNARAGRAALLSIPRDLKVNIPGHHADKINHAYRFGGIPLVHKTVENLLQEKIPRYAKLDFKTFKEIVDLLGGVEIDVPDVEGHGRGMNYDDNWDGLHIHLKPGLQRLNGEQAMGYVRYRRDSDTKRSERQRQFIKAMVDQNLRPTRLPAVLRAIRHILKRMNTNLSTGEAVGLLLALKRIGSANVMTAALPVESAPSHGIFYSRLQEPQATQLRQRMREFLAGNANAEVEGVDKPVAAPSATPAERALKNCRVAVFNGSGTPGIGHNAGEELRRAGVNVTATGNAQKFDYLRTEIRYHRGSGQAARQLRAILRTPLASVQEDDSFDAPGGADIVVTLGKDYRPK